MDNFDGIVNDEILTKIEEVERKLEINSKEKEMQVFQLFNDDDDDDVLVVRDVVGEPNVDHEEPGLYKLLVDLLEKLDGLEISKICSFTTYRGVHGLNVLPSRFEAHGFQFGTLLDAKKSKSRPLTKLDATDMSKKSQQRVKTIPLDDFGSDQNRLKNILTTKLGVKVLTSATVTTSAPAPTNTVSQSYTMSPTNTPLISTVSSVPPYTESQTSVPHDTLIPDTVSQSAPSDTSAPSNTSAPTNTLTTDTVLETVSDTSVTPGSGTLSGAPQPAVNITTTNLSPVSGPSVSARSVTAPSLSTVSQNEIIDELVGDEDMLQLRLSESLESLGTRLDPLSFQCIICKLRFAYLDELTTHCTSLHPGAEKPELEDFVEVSSYEHGSFVVRDTEEVDEVR